MPGKVTDKLRPTRKAQAPGGLYRERLICF